MARALARERAQACMRASGRTRAQADAIHARPHERALARVHTRARTLAPARAGAHEGGRPDARVRALAGLARKRRRPGARVRKGAGSRLRARRARRPAARWQSGGRACARRVRARARWRAHGRAGGRSQKSSRPPVIETPRTFQQERPATKAPGAPGSARTVPGANIAAQSWGHDGGGPVAAGVGCEDETNRKCPKNWSNPRAPTRAECPNAPSTSCLRPR